MDRASLLRALTVILVEYAAGAAWFSFDPSLTRLSPPIDLPTRATNAFLLPTTAAVLLWLSYVLESKRPLGVREPGDGVATERILFRCIVFIGGMHALVLLLLTEASGVQTWGPQPALILVGALLVSVGNLLPRTRPNVLVGIRTPRSLRSRHFWMEINRVGGYVSVAVGVVMIVAAVAFRFPVVLQVTGTAVFAALGILVARYRSLVRESERLGTHAHG